MTPLLQFSLTFVTLVVLTLVLYSRLARYEAYLKAEKEGMNSLNDRLQKLVDGLEALGTRRVEDQLGDIHEVLAAIRDGLERSASAPPAAGSAHALPSAPTILPGHGHKLGLVDVVEAKLYNLGYKRVAIVTDLKDADASEPLRIVVEAERDGALHKGHLILHGTAVTEFEMQPNYTSFP